MIPFVAIDDDLVVLQPLPCDLIGRLPSKVRSKVVGAPALAAAVAKMIERAEEISRDRLVGGDRWTPCAARAAGVAACVTSLSLTC